MIRLSKNSKNRLDNAVLLAASRLEDCQLTLKRLYYSRPSKFSEHVVRTINTNHDLRAILSPDSLTIFGEEQQINLVDASLRRLVARRRLRKDKIDVPVMLGGRSGKIVDRQMTCYWPTSVLDEIANC